jgi:hypothetical protein
VRDQDYALDAPSGKIRRLALGTIDAHETVYLDYAPLTTVHDDALIEAAVVEANGQVAAEVDPDREFGADPVIQSAATCVALAIVCRGSAARSLTSATPADRAALAWLQLAERYAERGENLMRRYRGPYSAPSVPARS